MYKVFFNDRVIVITTPIKKSLSKGEALFEVNNEGEIEVAWNAFRVNPLINIAYFTTSEPEKTKGMFFSLFKIIEAAGGIVINKNGDLLCIYRWGKWDLPKGKREKGETTETTAVREVEEECGISGIVTTGFNSTSYHIYPHPKNDNRFVLKETYWYNMLYGKDEELIPQVLEDITQAKWIPQKEIDIVLNNTWNSLKPIIEQWSNSVSL
jgi:8-oxo-dGTP pyrophosphatase MutT (NUDIX family)